ncbi:ABC transporter permease [Aquirufa regiilacus]|jgi:ABC-2 type transport system permease protein|uniref:ABC transporter permease n=1 Tax=Aquirufa regiilacus TaxID=3024868 RepID=A0ABU3TRW4_9BACT|nr:MULTISPECIES: ABC transporter permease [unclassified Aquirufa]MDT8888098.1 ABC transporter permease [Aquirufa sp. LEPPI-3A]MDU0808560.1 ABC transporter permease [Aquirufa sp. LEOWEIH-7C]
MNKILLVIQREYVTRVLKKSFWISSLLAPVLITAIYAIPIWLAMKDKEQKQIAIFDQSHLLKSADLQDKELVFTFTNVPEKAFKTQFAKSGYDAFVSIPVDVLSNPKGVHIYSSKNIGLNLKEAVERLIQNKVRQELMYKAGISAKVYEDTQVDIASETITVSENGGETSSSSAGAMILAGIMGLILYVTLLLYGSQVMNGVIEEKSSRIIEVIISSVKPYQLMLGKIIGVGLVGLTQFLLWIVLTIGLTQVTGKIYASKAKAIMAVDQGKASVDMRNVMQDSPMGEVTKVLESTNIPLILVAFLFYFFVGYLLYSSLFAAIGSAVESATEAQQFTFIVMIPIILSFLLAQYTMQDPDSTVAFWASMIPFTSPINMMVRLPYGVPMWELALSMSLLVVGFLACSWISARIYRVGILMYGKKATWKELSKWLFYKG